VMVGRAAYHDPWSMRRWDERFFGEPAREIDHDAVEDAMVDYMTRQAALGVGWPSIARHMLGLRHGQPGARHWRRVWSDQGLKHEAPAMVSRLARASVRQAALEATA
jgi:tRNA-dihydrouridine synthase A